MDKFVSFVVYVALFLATGLIVGCDGGRSESYSPTAPTSTAVYAPPPVGVSPEVWRVAFSSNGRLNRPEPPSVHLDVSAFGADIKAIFAEMAGIAEETVERKTSIDLVPGGAGATFVVSVVPDLLCNSRLVAGCTRIQTDQGRVVGGKMEFDSLLVMQSKPLVLHEIFRTLGLSESSPVSGIMSSIPWRQARATDEERLMFLGRYNYPLLAFYADK